MIKDLSVSEHKLLLAMTYIYGQQKNSDEIINFATGLFSRKSDCSRTFSNLVSRNYVVKDERHRFRYPALFTLRRGLFLPLLKELLSGKNEDVLNKIQEIYEQKYPRRPLSIDMNCALKLFVTEKGKPAIVNISLPTQLKGELTGVVDDADFEKPLHSLSDKDFLACLSDRLNKVILSEEGFNWETARQIVEERDKTNKLSYGEILSCFNYFYYLHTGAMCTDLEDLPVNVYSLCTAAIKTLYAGNYASAYKIFAKAMTAHNKLTMDLKSMFFNDVTNYFYVMCLILNGDDTSMKKFDTLIHKMHSFYNPATRPLFYCLYDYFRKHENPAVADGGLNMLVAERNLATMTWLVWMIYSKLGLWPEKLKAPSLTTHTPQGAWLRNELKPSGVIPATDNASELFGGGSLFDRLEVKAVWQMKLEEIIQETSGAGNAAGGKEAQQARIIYVLRYGQINIIYQKMRKTGGWSVGRHLNAEQFKKMDEAWLDQTDMKFMTDITSWTYNIDIDDYLPDLVGCDHVFADEDCTLPVNIHEDKPFLVIDKRRNGTFAVSAHPSEIIKDKLKSFIIVKNSETDYSVFRPTAFEQRIYQQIVAQKTYPAKAEPLLKKLMATIGGRTEIHSNMIVDNVGLKKVDAPTKITIRCVPQAHDQYGISVMVHALGSLSFVPGKGAVTTVAEEDGKRVQVVRKLRVEKVHMDMLCDELADLGVIEDADDWAPKSVADVLPLGVADLLPLLDWVKQNSDVCDMEWPENVRVKYHPVLGASGVSINIKSKNGWFDVEGDIKIDDRQVISLQRMLELMHGSYKNKYIRIGDQEYITLSHDLSKILKRLDTVTTDRRNHLQMSTAAVGLIGDVLDNKEISITRSKAVDQIRSRIKKSAKLEPKVPKTLKADLRDYQVAGFEWMSRTTSWGAGVCLADDMGLGKTVQTIALLLEQQKEGPSLIVAPASVVPNWRNELRRFAPTLNATILNEAADRTEAVNSAKAGDIVVTTYALLNIEQESLTKKEWNVICLDEAHTIKNPNTKMSKAAMQLQAKRKVELTGTPIQNHLSELWNLFQFINPGLLGSFEQFSKKYIMPVEADHNKERQNQLKRLISPFLLRRTKGEVIEELPEKNEIVLPVELSSDEMTMYEMRRRETVEAVKSSKIVKVSTLAEITRLRQMACSCSLVDKKWKRTSSKVEAFIDLAESLNDSGNRALVFSQFTSFFAEVRRAMDKAKLPYLYLDGTTPMKQREKLVAEFQNGECPFFLISLKAGGLGLNLTGANYVIHLDPWWNPAIEQQATDRAYRIGQKQDVTVYHLISQHTIEEKILRLHKTKRDLADSLLEGTDMSHTLTQEELLELLK